MTQHHLRWGQGCTREDLKLEWHIPSTAETDFVMELIDTFLRPTLKRLRDMLEAESLGDARDRDTESMDVSNSITSPIKTASSKGRNESTKSFCKDLNLVRQFLSGMGSMVTDDLDAPVSNPCASVAAEDSAYDERDKAHFRRQILAGNCFDEGNFGNIPDVERALRRAEILQLRFDVGVLLNDVMQHLLAKREDDVENAKAVIKVVQRHYVRGAPEVLGSLLLRYSFWYSLSVCSGFPDRPWHRTPQM